MAVLDILLLSIVVNVTMSYGYNDTGTSLDIDSGSKVLSRRKRFLVFPEGSSFQMVFCSTFPTIFTIGDIFLVGYTAALAYELPQDPYSPFDHHADPLHRRADTKMIYFTNSEGKVLWGKKYHRITYISKRLIDVTGAAVTGAGAGCFLAGSLRPIVNPAMAKRSVNKKEKLEIDRKLMHAPQHKREFLKSEHTEAEFHRIGRATLYPKIEAVLSATGRNGKDCVLRTLCQVGQTRHHPQESFFQEIMRAVFTLPKGSNSEEMRDYDKAHSAVDSCEELYPNCEEPTANDIPTFSY